MKIYKWTTRDYNGVSIGYAGSLAEAKRNRAQAIRTSKEEMKELKEEQPWTDPMAPIAYEIDCYEVPITKQGLLDFLRLHTPHTDNG